MGTFADDHRRAKQGDAEAQFNLGIMYEKGRGVRQDDKEAVSWYRKAAEQGHARAQYYLGMMYAKGKGVPQDSKEAVSWYRKAVEQGQPGAQFSLGEMYANGLGVPQDYKEAVFLYRKVAEQGHPVAQYYLGKMYANGEGVPQDYTTAYAWVNIAGVSIYNHYNKELRSNAVKLRDDLAEKLSPPQLAEAHRLARECIDSGYKRCPR